MNKTPLKNPTPKNSLAPYLPSMADVFFITVFLSRFLKFGRDLLADGDTGIHIRVGQFILDHRWVPKFDVFSSFTPPLPWVVQEWLSAVVMALVHRCSGLTGIVIFFSLLTAFVSYFLFKIVKSQCNIVFATLITVLAIGSCSVHWLARPHIFSQIFLLITYFLLDQHQYKNKRLLYFIPPMMLLWANLHGGFIMGPILISIYLLGNTLKFIFSSGRERAIHQNRIRPLAFTLIASLAVSLLNPQGVHLLLYPFKTIQNGWLMQHVQEFVPTNFRDASFFKYFFFLMIGVFAFSRTRLNIVELILVVFFTNMAFFSIRHVSLFALIVAPILAKQSEGLLRDLRAPFQDALSGLFKNMAAIDASPKVYRLPAILVLTAIIGMAASKMDFRFDEKAFPVAALDFIKKEGIRGRMFNNETFGDYFIYAAPDYKVFLDGRMDPYPQEILDDYWNIVAIEPGWRQVLEEYQIDWIIYNSGGPLSLLLIESDDWKLIYSDKTANIFVRKNGINQGLIEKYPNVKQLLPGSETALPVAAGQ